MAVSPSSHARDFSWKSEVLAALNFEESGQDGVGLGQCVLH